MPKLSLRSPLTVVVTLEGLATSPLGCYGCSWNQTPAIDALAATGVVWDRWTSPVDRPGSLITRWLDDSRQWIARQANHGATVFLTDDPKLTIPEDQFGFSQAIALQPTLKRLPAETVEATVLAQAFAASIQAITPETRLIWIHSGMLRDHWDAPVTHDDDEEEIQEPVEDEGQQHASDEPEPFFLPPTTDPPTQRLSKNDDPDLLFTWMQRYAAQVRLLDEMIDLLGESVRRRRPRIVLAGTSGFSLGENGWLGHHVGPLRSQDVRLPMLVSCGGPLRVPSLQSAAELPELLERLLQDKPLITPAEWCRSHDAHSLSVRTDSDRAVNAVTTPNWFYVHDADTITGGKERLFVKPDDINDVNDIARLRREVLIQFATAADSDGSGSS